MCEHCKNGESKDISASFSYSKSTDGESTSRSMVSKIITHEEFEDVLHHLLIGMKCYAEKVCKIDQLQFSDIVRRTLAIPLESDSFLRDSLSKTSPKTSLLYN